MLKQLFSSFIILFIINTAKAQNPCPDFEWAISEGMSSQVYAIAADDAGNSYVTGIFFGTVMFGNTTLTSSGNARDVYIAKLDMAGNYIWAKKVGVEPLSNGHNIGNAAGISIDSLGNVYVTGTFRGKATFGNIVLISPLLQSPIFVAKLNASGNFIWAKKIQGEDTQNATDMQVGGVAVDGSGNVYLTGASKNRLIFGNILGPITGIFVTKLDETGNFLWVKGGEHQGPYNPMSRGMDIAVDASGNSYVTGSFAGILTLGNTTLNSSGDQDILIAKWDASGNLIWAGQAGGASGYAEWGLGVIMDDVGNTYITGTFYETAVFGNTTLTTGNSDIFIAKLNASGNFDWAKAFGVTDNGYGNDIVLDNVGNIYVTGAYTGSVTLGNTTLTSYGISSDVFITKLDASGNNFLWATQGSPVGLGNGWGAGIAINSLGNNYVVGVLGGAAVFGDYTLASGSFVTQLNACGNLGINHLDSSNISIYPNPTNFSLTVEGGPIGSKLYITDISGKMVYNQHIVSEKAVIDTGSFPNGVYFISIEHNGNRTVKKLIIKK